MSANEDERAGPAGPPVVDVSWAARLASRPPKALRPHWAAMAGRVGGLLLRPAQATEELVRRSYDAAAGGYDAAWTAHMRDLTETMLERLGVPPGAECLDVGCGTGLVTGELARRSGRPAVGIDASAGMLAEARRAHGESCRFLWADAVDYLRARRSASADAIACAWALGYSRPVAVVRQAARVLRRGGRLGIIDNSVFSLGEVLWAAVRTFAERPAALVHAMKVRFLPSAGFLAALMRACGLRVVWQTGGQRTFWCANGRAVIEKLRATGAAAGFEFAAAAEQREVIFARFAEWMEVLWGTERGVPVTHRYLAAVGAKP